jgi:hypothetical protein
MPRSKKQPLIGNGMNANLLKEFIDLSYKGNTSIAPEGYSIDSPLSDSRVKVYTKNGSNDKNVVVTHRGSVGLDDWLDNATYLFKGKVKGTKTYNLHRERHKKAVEKYGAKNIIAIGHSRAGLYLQELQKEFPIKENITYNKASGFHDIGRENDPNQTDIRVGNDIVSLLAPLQKRPTNIVKIDGTKNPLDFNTAHQSSEIDKLGTTFIGKKEEEEPKLTGLKPIVALRPDKPKPNPTAMLNYGKNNLTGEGITPRISSEYRIRKLLGVEQRRLKRIRDGTTKYKSKYITESKTLEKISRLKKRLASAEENEGQATETFFVPKTEKWLKINKNDTYLNTPLKEDGKHQQMVSEIDKMIADLKAKKGKKNKKTSSEPIKIAITEKKAEQIKAVVKEEVKKAEEAVKVETKKVKFKDLTKEEQLAKKKEYDRLRYLKIKAKKLEEQAKTTETPKQVEKLEENVEEFKEEVKELVADVKEDEYRLQLYEFNTSEGESLFLVLNNSVIVNKSYKIVAYLKSDGVTTTKGLDSDKKYDKIEVLYRRVYKDKEYLAYEIDSDTTDKEVAFTLDKTTKKLTFKGILTDEGFIDTDERVKQIDNQKVLKKTYDNVMKEYNIEDEPIQYLFNMKLKDYAGNALLFNKYEHRPEVYQIIDNEVKIRGRLLPREKGKKEHRIMITKIKDVPSIVRFYHDDNYEDPVVEYNNIQIEKQEKEEEDKKKEGSGFNKKQLRQIVLDKNKVIADLEETAYGSGFNKKQLRQIILDKNKVIADLEETAYGGNYNPHSYLDNILDNNTTSQNRVILSEKISNVPKYIKSLVGD